MVVLRGAQAVGLPSFESFKGALSAKIEKKKLPIKTIRYD
jgi:hypothetical protein